MPETPEMPADEPEIDAGAPDWTKGAVIIAGGAGVTLAKTDKRVVIVVESYGDPKEGEQAERKVTGYPKGDVYLRFDEETVFPDNAPALTIGADFRQGGFWGFSPSELFLNTGPSHPAYAAANLAWLRGATDIEIHGLTKFQKERMEPFLKDLKDRAKEPAPESATAPAAPDVSITLK